MKYLHICTVITSLISATSGLKLTRGSTNLVMKSEIPKWAPKSFLPALLGAALFLNSPDASHALQSGSRSGGSSFRSSTRSYSAPSSRSYSAPSRSYSSSPSISITPVMPMYSPFGYSPFGLSPFGFSPFSFIPINFNLIVVAGVAYVVYQLLSNRIGGSDFSNNFNGSLGTGASLVKLTISMDADWGKDRNIMQQLSQLASKYNAMTDRTDLSKLLSETCLALLRSRSDWTASSYSSEHFKDSNIQNAESAFQQLAIKERTKFEQENDGITDSPYAFLRPAAVGSLPTQAVVSIVVAIRGRSDAVMKSVRGSQDVVTCLQRLAADALTDEGENVMALEVLWSPSDPSLTLSERDLIVDYPDLMKL